MDQNPVIVAIEKGEDFMKKSPTHHVLSIFLRKI